MPRFAGRRRYSWPTTRGSEMNIAHVTAQLAAAPYQVNLAAGPHRLVGDEPAALGGGGTGPSPFQLLLSGLGACTAITLRMYCERKGWALDGAEVDLRMTKDGDTQRVERVITLRGTLDEGQRARLAEIAEKTPVTRVVKQGVEVHTRLA
jgi:putative redox protein